MKSDLRYKIEAEFRRNEISIPFPQRDLHIRSDFRQQRPTTGKDSLGGSLKKKEKGKKGTKEKASPIDLPTKELGNASE